MITLYDANGRALIGVGGGTPALVLGTANVQGVQATVLRIDDTIAVFDTVAPTTSAFGDATAIGTAAFAARRDHLHGMPPRPDAALVRPVSFMGAAGLLTNTVFVTNTSYFLYIGRANFPITTLTVIANVTVAAATITWAEIGCFSGIPSANSTASLSRAGFTDVSAIYNTTGVKVTAITLSGVTSGTDLWVAFGSQATTPYQIRGGLAYETQDGGFQSVAGRISTLAVPVTTALESAASAIPWCMVAW